MSVLGHLQCGQLRVHWELWICFAAEHARFRRMVPDEAYHDRTSVDTYADFRAAYMMGGEL